MSLKCNNSSFTSVSDKHPRLVVTLIRYDREERSSFSIFLPINVLLIVLGIIVNLAICFVMLRKNRYRRNTSNLFILHLSVTELVYRLLIFPVVIYIAVQTSTVSSVHCKLISFISETCGSAILVSLVAIAIDRYQHIVHPLGSFKAKKKTFFRVSLVWLYASIISIPYVISVESISDSKIPETQGTRCINCTVRKLCDIPQNLIGQLSVILYFLLAFAFPVAAAGLLYSKIIMSLRRRRNNGIMHKVAARSKCKAVRMLIVTVSGYVLSVGPAVVFAILRSFGILNSASFEVILIANELVGLTTYTSSLGNPLIYGYYNKDFRRELSRLFCRRKDTNIRKQTTTFNRCNRNTARWVVSPWNPCSKTCGQGLQYRSVRCMHQAPDGTIGVSPSRLCTSDKPSGVQHCIRKACHLRWLADPWSQCHGLCGLGYNLRKVRCPVKGKCAQWKRPVSRKPCFKRPCYYWTTGEWGSCSAECGLGKQRRTVSCVNRLNGKTSGACNTGSKPASSRKCKIKECSKIDLVSETVCNKDKYNRKQCQTIVKYNLCTTRVWLELCCKTCQDASRL